MSPQTLFTAQPSAQSVTVTDIRMPFGSMVLFMVKWSLASIPALLILIFSAVMFVALIGAFFNGIGGVMRSLL